MDGKERSQNGVSQCPEPSNMRYLKPLIKKNCMMSTSIPSALQTGWGTA